MKHRLIASGMWLTVLYVPQLQFGTVLLGQVQTFNDPDSDWVTGVGPVFGSPTAVPIATAGGRQATTIPTC